MNKQVKSVYISSDGDSPTKPFCRICSTHHVLIGNLYRCPECGTSATADEAGKVDRKILIADNPEPMVAHSIDPKKVRSPDFPLGATILYDEERINL